MATSAVQFDAAELGHDWKWFLVLGILLIIVGVLAIGSAVVATLVSVVFLGWLLIIGGIMQIIAAFGVRERHHHLFLQLLLGILSVVVGFLLVRDPATGAVSLTLILAVYFVVSGAFRIGASIGRHYANWGWSLFSGIVTFVLGVLVWWQLPVIAFWFLGFAVGLDMILHGWSWITMSLVARRAVAAT